MIQEPRFDEWLRGQLVEAYGMERETWAVDQVRRVIDKINGVRNREPQFTVEVLWLREMTAFTAPGRFIYISRRLLERLPHDDAVAMALAHEAAHHDLDHLADFGGWTRRLPRKAGSWLVARLFRAIERRVYSQEHEFEADRYGLRLCRQANFDGLKCLELFDIMKQYVLDYGDDEAAYGSDAEQDIQFAENAADWIFLKLRAEFSKLRRRTHPAISDRKSALKAELAKMRL